MLQAFRIGRNEEPSLTGGVLTPSETDDKVFKIFGKSMIQIHVFRYESFVRYIGRPDSVVTMLCSFIRVEAEEGELSRRRGAGKETRTDGSSAVGKAQGSGAV